MVNYTEKFRLIFCIESVWFVIINYGSQVEYLRQQPDLLLQELNKDWQLSGD